MGLDAHNVIVGEHESLSPAHLNVRNGSFSARPLLTRNGCSTGGHHGQLQTCITKHPLQKQHHRQIGFVRPVGKPEAPFEPTFLAEAETFVEPDRVRQAFPDHQLDALDLWNR